MFTIIKEAWKGDVDGYAIKEVELHLKPEEAVLLLDALYRESDASNVMEHDRKTAREMYDDIAERMTQCGWKE